MIARRALSSTPHSSEVYLGGREGGGRGGLAPTRKKGLVLTRGLAEDEGRMKGGARGCKLPGIGGRA